MFRNVGGDKVGQQQTCGKQREERAQIEIIMAHLSDVFS